jgi:hypothetical protein
VRHHPKHVGDIAALCEGFVEESLQVGDDFSAVETGDAGHAASGWSNLYGTGAGWAGRAGAFVSGASSWRAVLTSGWGSVNLLKDNAVSATPQ